MKCMVHAHSSQTSTPCEVPEMSPHLPELFTMFFYKESYCVEYVEQTAEVVKKL